MSAGFIKPSAGPCAKVVAAVFGSLFLIALLTVPVTTRTSQLRQDPQSHIVTRITYPRNMTMSLPSYLSAKARSHGAGDIRVRSAQWIGTMAVVLILGVFDYFVFCHLLRRRRRPPEEP